MTAPAPKLNAELAWEIQDWNDANPDSNDGTKLSRTEILSLATFLTEKGYTKGKSGGFSGLLSSIEEVGAKLADEVGPIAEALAKYRK